MITAWDLFKIMYTNNWILASLKLINLYLIFFHQKSDQEHDKNN